MKNLLASLTDTDNSFAPLALRLPVAIIFMAHGAQKLFGWFGGHGLEGTGQWMASIGLEPGYLMALGAGSAEFLGPAGRQRVTGHFRWWPFQRRPAAQQGPAISPLSSVLPHPILPLLRRT